MRTMLKWLLTTLAVVTAATTAGAQDKGYHGAPRSFLFNPALDVCFHDTAKYKKKPPYVIGFFLYLAVS